MDSSTNSLRRGRFFIKTDTSEGDSHAAAHAQNPAQVRKEDSRSFLPVLSEEVKIDPRAVDTAKDVVAEVKAKHILNKIPEDEKPKLFPQKSTEIPAEVAKSRSPPVAVVETTADKETETPAAFHGAVVNSLNEWSSGKRGREETGRGNVDTSSLSVPMDVFLSFNSTVSTQFTAMLQLHREIMMELIHRDARRDEQSLFLCQENAKLVRQLTGMEVENRSTHDSVYRIKE